MIPASSFCTLLGSKLHTWIKKPHLPQIRSQTDLQKWHSNTDKAVQRWTWRAGEFTRGRFSFQWAHDWPLFFSHICLHPTSLLGPNPQVFRLPWIPSPRVLPHLVPQHRLPHLLPSTWSREPPSWTSPDFTRPQNGPKCFPTSLSSTAKEKIREQCSGSLP